MTLKQKFQNEIETESTASLNMGDVLSWGVLIFGEGQPPGIPKPETDQSIARLGSRIPDQAWALERKGWQGMMKKSNSHMRRFTLTPFRRAPTRTRVRFTPRDEKSSKPVHW